ncbi:hypothetical protein AB0C34_17015 [Nocardia sp. NPDC049220]|uniref:hypothetical protein n=1 Tax=Nocardia sp. NPDC049220 TaxID=3155273 RepID=UPI0033CEBA61
MDTAVEFAHHARSYTDLCQDNSPAAAAAATEIRDRLLDPHNPLPEAVLTPQIAALRTALPASVLDHPGAHQAVVLAARGLHIVTTLYGDPATGQLGRIIGDLERPEFAVLAAYHHGGGLLDAITALHQHLTRCGASIDDILDAIAAEAYSDAVYGHGRRRDNPTGYDELRSAELLHAHARAAGYPDARAERLRDAVLGTAFDEQTKAQAGRDHPDIVVQAVVAVDLHVLACPDAVTTAMDLAVEDGMSARWSPDRIIGRAIAETGARIRSVPEALAFIDAHADRRPRLDNGAHADTTVIEMFADRLIGNAKFIAAHRYPDTWTLDNPELRATNAAVERDLGQQLSRRRITAVAAYRAAAEHVTTMSTMH